MDLFWVYHQASLRENRRSPSQSDTESPLTLANLSATLLHSPEYRTAKLHNLLTYVEAQKGSTCSVNDDSNNNRVWFEVNQDRSKIETMFGELPLRNVVGPEQKLEPVITSPAKSPVKTSAYLINLKRRAALHADFLSVKKTAVEPSSKRVSRNESHHDAEDADESNLSAVNTRTDFITAREKLKTVASSNNNVRAPTYGRHADDIENSSSGKRTISSSSSSNISGTGGKIFSRFKSPVIKVETPVDKVVDGVVDGVETELFKGIDAKLIELIKNEILDTGDATTWDEIAGLSHAKKTIEEIVIWPMLRPDIFTGLRGPPKGLLLFGPPGTGKTLLGKCIASQSGATFFSISASSLTSKWVGEGEKLVRALFAVARAKQPAVIFIDEIDSILSARSETEHESSRRIKTEFLVQLDGAATASDDKILVIGATNRPHELDEAARRRLVKRLYIPLPDPDARKTIIHRLLTQFTHAITNDHTDNIVHLTDGYSGADMANLCKEAALGPIRSLNHSEIITMKANDVRPIVIQDFIDATMQVRASVGQKDLQLYLDWNEKYGSMSSI